MGEGVVVREEVEEMMRWGIVKEAMMKKCEWKIVVEEGK